MSDFASVDRITSETLAALAAMPGPWVTITLPTARTGAEVREGPRRFRVLAGQAIELLGDLTDPASLELVAGRFDALLGDHEFWEHQADGLVVLASPSHVRTFRVAPHVAEGVRASNGPGLAELAVRVDAGDPWFIVAISQNRVRLLRATAQAVDELPVEDIPASFDDAVGDIERQEHLSWSAQPGGGANFHGLGGGGENDKVWLEKYLRRVVDGLETHSSRPGTGTVVLAGVESLVASLRSIWGAPGILAARVAGNPDHLSAHDLHAAAIPHVESDRERREEALLERLGARGEHEAGAILRAASEGRVAELALGTTLDDADLTAVDTAIRDTLAFGGSVRPLRSLAGPMVALLRY